MLTNLAINALRRMKLNVWYFPEDLGLKRLSSVTLNTLENDGYIKSCFLFCPPDQTPKEATDADAISKPDRWRYNYQIIKKIKEPDTPTLQSDEWDIIQTLVDKYGTTLPQMITLGRTPAHAMSHTPLFQGEWDRQTNILEALNTLRNISGTDYRAEREKAASNKRTP